MALFDLPPKSSANVAELNSRINNAAAPVIVRGAAGSGKQNIIESINAVTLYVNQNLGKYREEFDCIRSPELFVAYIDNCIKDGVVAIDTETSGLDPLTCNIAGMSFCSQSQKAVYVPLKHLSYITMQPAEGQIEIDFVREQLKRLEDAGVKIIMHNANFDIRVIKNQVGIMLTCYWDTYLAARVLNENEPSNELKKLHNKYCLQGSGDAFSYDDLFSGFNFQYIPIKTGFVYAANDAKITYELFRYQEPFLTPGTEECLECNLVRVVSLFRDIEMAVLPEFIALEETGVYFDYEVQKRLSEKYHAKLALREQEFWEICNKYRQEINSYVRIAGVNNKLDDPINIGSATQIAILLYDILNLECPDKKKPRGTGEDVISKIDHPICKAILNYREVTKILGTYVDKMPDIVNPTTGRIHARYNQIGADTGRTSSQDPNMQNIPSRGEGKEIREMFSATPGYCLISSDYSAQEPRITAHLSHDERMIEAYRQGKDLYCEIASIAYGLPYEECTEHRPDGSTNPEGKKRRSEAKAIVLGKPNGFAPWPLNNAPLHSVRFN